MRYQKKGNQSNCAKCGKLLLGQRSDAKYCSTSCRATVTKRRMKIQRGEFVAGEIYPCKECGKSFIKKTTINEFCSKSCVRSSYKKATATEPRINKCTICGGNFHPNSSMHRMCSKECLAKQRKNVRLLRLFGITSQDFTNILNKQGGVCAICKKTPETWAVDHDHSCCEKTKIKTCGKCIRGILCVQCNQGLGIFKDSEETLKMAITYLQNNKKNTP